MKLRTMAPVLALLVLPTTACEDILFDDPEHVYDGPPVVEFAPVLPAGNYTRTVTLARTATDNVMTTVRVNYVSAAPTGNVTGEITSVNTSTAVDGTHYRFTSGSHYTIAAGSNFVDVPIEVLAAGLAPEQSVTLVLELLPGDAFQVSEKYSRFTLTLRRS
jgi:hypothetical protein